MTYRPGEICILRALTRLRAVKPNETEETSITFPLFSQFTFLEEIKDLDLLKFELLGLYSLYTTDENLSTFNDENKGTTITVPRLWAEKYITPV